MLPFARASSLNGSHYPAQVVHCAGGLVGALVRSGAHSYCEFKAVEATAFAFPPTASSPATTTPRRIALVAAPTTRSEVFTTLLLTPAEKRALGRVVSACAGHHSSHNGSHGSPAHAGASPPAAALPPAADPSSADAPPRPPPPPLPAPLAPARGAEPFAPALAACGLSPRLSSLVLTLLCFMDGDDAGATVENGTRALARHAESAGAFAHAGGGAASLLVPLYGTGELCQAFARAAAVGGAVTALRRPLEGVILAAEPLREDGQHRGERVCGVRLGGQLVACRALAAGGCVWDGFARA